MKQLEKFLTWGLILLLAALVIATILLGSVPPVDRDALTHHLFVPKLWLQHGGIYEIPEIPFSYYPMNLDLLYTIPLYFGNDIIPKHIHYLFALLTGWMLFRYLNHNLGKLYGLFGALFFLSIPIIVKLSITVYVDLGLVFFSTAALLLLLRWAEKGFPWRLLILSGLCCGLAAGTKYNGLVTVVILTLLTPIIYQRSVAKHERSSLRALLYGCVFALATATAFSPWFVRNYLLTGNPIYPLHHTFFQSLSPANTATGKILEEQSIDPTVEQTKQGLDTFTARKIMYQETWWQALLLPVRFFFEGQDDNPQFFDGKLNPFLLLLALFALLRGTSSARMRREQGFLLAFTAIFFFFTFFQNVLRIRYIASIIPSLIILAVYGLHAINTCLLSVNSTALPFISRVLILVIPTAALLYNGHYIVQQWHIIQPLSYIDGTTGRDAYISQFRVEYPAVQFINNSIQPTKTLALFLGNRGYYFDGPVQFDFNEGKSHLCELVKRIPTDIQIAVALAADNISHLLIRYDLFNHWVSEHLTMTEQERLLRFLQSRTQLVYEANGHGVFLLKPQQSSSE